MKKRNFLKVGTDRGITLIALVITIVIMLILAGVTINLTLGQNGIFTTAQKAAQNYTQAQNQEMAGVIGFSEAIDKTINSLNEGIYYATDKAGNTIPVPVGFSAITTLDQGTKDTGFVIKNDNDGNEFVWIPVDSGENYQRIGWWRDDWAYRQTLKETGEITRYDTGVVWTETMPTDEQLSVSRYGGYYIGRYEAGVKNYSSINKTREDATATIWTAYEGNNTTLVIQKEQEAWVYITRDKAKAVSEDLYNKETDNVTSKLCSSYAWDTALKFIEKTNSNYPTNSIGGNYDVASGGTGRLQETGYHVINNIYDMAGNVFEWTTEISSNSNNPYTVRGGVFLNSASDLPAGDRRNGANFSAENNIAFRVTLFM